MRKFDLIYERLLCKINEKEYIENTFEDNIRLLIKTLQVNDFLPKSKSTENILKQTMEQTDQVKTLILDTEDKGMPPIKVAIKHDAGTTASEDFSVTVIPVSDPKSQKEFKNSMMETIFDEVIEYIRSVALKGLQPQAAVEQLPPEQGANAQPGADQSALPQQPPAPTA